MTCQGAGLRARMGRGERGRGITQIWGRRAKELALLFWLGFVGHVSGAIGSNDSGSNNHTDKGKSNK